MRTLTVALMGLLWAVPGFCGGEAIARLAKVLNTPTARFAIGETFEGARMLERVGGKVGMDGNRVSALMKALEARPGSMDEFASELESRLMRIERRFRTMQQGAVDEAFTQTFLRRIVREEMNIGPRKPRHRILGRQEIEFVTANPAHGNLAAAEEIFLDTAGREVISPREIFDNLALSTDRLRLMIQSFNIKDPALDLWVGDFVITYSEAAGYLRKAGPISNWEGSFKTPSFEASDKHWENLIALMKLSRDAKAIVSRLEVEYSPALTRALKSGFDDTQSYFDTMIERAKAIDVGPRAGAPESSRLPR